MIRSSRAKHGLLIFLILLSVGSLGYSLIEGWNLLDSFYMTVITLSTVGFREVSGDLSPVGKLFTIVLILSGVGVLFYASAQIIEALLEGTLLQRRRVRKELGRMREHVIVCGYGRMGRTVSEQVMARGMQIVVVERDPEVSDLLEERGIRHVRGDATDDASLVEAGIERARALATILPHDADNLFVTLSARKLRDDIAIVARASVEKNEPKMAAAGATRVLNPYRRGGQIMAQQLLHPVVTEFMDVISSAAGGDLELAEVLLQPGSSLDGVMLRDAPIRKELDVIVLGVRHPDQELIFNPPSEMTPRVGDVLVVLGHRDNLRRLETLAG